MRRNTLSLSLALAAAVAIVWYYTHPGKASAFQTAPVERGEVSSIVSANGTCAAVVTVQVGTQVSGNIKALHADFNTRVHKGQVLAEIDPAPFQARLEQAEAALETAKADVTSAKAAVAKAEADVRSALAERQNQEAAVTLARSIEQDSQTKYLRRKEAVESIFVPEDLETAETAYEIALAARESAQAQEEAAEDLVKSAEEAHDLARIQVEAADAQVRQAQAVVEQAKLDLAHTSITAPIDGLVISRDVDAGQTVAASYQAPTLFEIAQDLTQMEVNVNVDESDVSKVRVGQAAEFTVDALPGVTFDATVKQIREAPINVQNVITYVVVLSVSNPREKLFPGMTANVHIRAGRHENVLKVPNAALRFHPLEKIDAIGVSPNALRPPWGTVYVLDREGRPSVRKVETGFSEGSFTEIRPGDLHEGDLVIVTQSDLPT
jgi:HlyD family secretion protein